MATKFYFHSAANTVTGTMPVVPITTPSISNNATGATTLKKINTTIGTTQTSAAGASTANANAQGMFMGGFVSDTLAAQTVGGGTVTLNVANAMSNTNMNFYVNWINVYIWRPGTGVKVGDVILDNGGAPLGATGNLTGAVKPTAAASEQVCTGTHTSTGVTCAVGDIIVVELWAAFQESMATSYTGTFYFDGTTENTTNNAVVTNHASFIQFTENITFSSGTVANTGRFFAFFN